MRTIKAPLTSVRETAAATMKEELDKIQEARAVAKETRAQRMTLAADRITICASAIQNAPASAKREARKQRLIEHKAGKAASASADLPHAAAEAVSTPAGDSAASASSGGNVARGGKARAVPARQKKLTDHFGKSPPTPASTDVPSPASAATFHIKIRRAQLPSLRIGADELDSIIDLKCKIATITGCEHTDVTLKQDSHTLTNDESVTKYRDGPEVWMKSKAK